MNPGYATLPPFQYQTFNTSSITYYNLAGHIQVEEPKPEAEDPAPNDAVPDPIAISPPDIVQEVSAAQLNQPDLGGPNTDGDLPPLDVFPSGDGILPHLGPIANEGPSDVQVKDFAETKAVRKTKGQKFLEAAKAAQIARLEKGRESKALKADRDKIEKEQKRKLAEKTRKEKALKQAAKLEKANRKKVYGSAKKSTNVKPQNNEAESQGPQDEAEAETTENQDPAAPDETPEDITTATEEGDVVDSPEAVSSSSSEGAMIEGGEQTESSKEVVEGPTDVPPLEQSDPETATAEIITESANEAEEQSHVNDEPIPAERDNEAMAAIGAENVQGPSQDGLGQDSEIPVPSGTEVPVDEVVLPVPEIVDAQPDTIDRDVALAEADSHGDNPDVLAIAETANDGEDTQPVTTDTVLETQPLPEDAQGDSTEQGPVSITPEIPLDQNPSDDRSGDLLEQDPEATGESLDSSPPVLTLEQVLDDRGIDAAAEIVDEQATPPASLDIPEAQETLDETILSEESPASNEDVSDTIQVHEEVTVWDQADETEPLPSVGEAQIAPEEPIIEEPAVLVDEQITDPSFEVSEVVEETSTHAKPIDPLPAIQEPSALETAEQEEEVVAEQENPASALEIVDEPAEQPPPVESEEASNSEPVPSEPEPAPAEPEFVFKMPVKYASYKDDPEISDFVKNAIAAALAARAAGIPLSQIPLNGEPFVEPPPAAEGENEPEAESSSSSSDTVMPEKVHVEDDLIAKMAQVLGITEESPEDEQSVEPEAELDSIVDETGGGSKAPNEENNIVGEPESEHPPAEESASQTTEAPQEPPVDAASDSVAEPKPQEINPVLEEVIADADPEAGPKPQEIDPVLEEALIDAEPAAEGMTLAPEATIPPSEGAVLTDESIPVFETPITGKQEVDAVDVVDEPQEAKLEPIEENTSSEPQVVEPPKQDDEADAVSPLEAAREINDDVPPSPEEQPGTTEPGAAPKQKRRRRRVDGSERRASNSSVPLQPAPVITSQRRPSKPEAVRTNSVFGNLFGFSKPVQSTQSRSPVETQPVIVRDRVRRRRSSQSESERPKSARVDSFEPVSPVIVEDQADSPISTKSRRRDVEGGTRHGSRRQRRTTYRVVETENKDTPPQPKPAEEEEARRVRREARRAAKDAAEEPQRRSDRDGKERDRERKDRSTRNEIEDRSGRRTTQPQRQTKVDEGNSGRKGLFSNLKKLVTSSS